MSLFLWILLSGLLMAAIAMVGSLTLLLKESTLQRILHPLVAFAAGSLLGGALFHMLPAALGQLKSAGGVFGYFAMGFVTFLALEQFLHWHHCHRQYAEHREPATYLILLADGLHNFLGGLAIGSIFLVDIRLGLSAWLAAAAHEVPQELGDFAVLVKGGWKKGQALLYNVLSGLTFPLGGILAWLASENWQMSTDFLIAFGAGNFVYIGASDLIPEVNKGKDLRAQGQNFLAFCLGLGLLWWLGQQSVALTHIFH